MESKRILIVGENSYIGVSFERYLNNNSNDYIVETISVRDDEWKQRQYDAYDVCVYVAGIAHRKETKENCELYYRVNRDLAYEFACKAKEDGVNHFIYLSSMSVYGVSKGVITRDTKPRPKSNYGKSKLEAEKLLQSLISENFSVSVLRPPMVYGEGCKGNYQLLKKFALVSPIFPYVRNKRSMVHIDKLCHEIHKIINLKESNIYFPQDEEYICTSDMVKKIAEGNGKNICLFRGFGWILKNINLKITNKVFGDLYYDL